MKHYNCAPLPFMGQKRRFLKELNQILESYSDDAVFIDLFGGSGLLSHFVKSKRPEARVVWNDYDDYSKRLAAIAETNRLLTEIRNLVKSWPRDKKITGQTRESILKLVKDAETLGWVDYISLSSSLLFSMNYVTNFQQLSASTLYNKVKESNYNADGYLEGVERFSCDYQELFNEFKSNQKVVFLVDPPYLSTETKTYSMSWKLCDYLNVLQVIDGHRYIYFTSNKSSIVELCEWIGTRTITANPFFGAQTRTVNVTMNYNSTYTDIMLFK